MSIGVTILIVAVVVIAAALATATALRPRQRSRRLKQQFGPEYDRTLAEHNGDSRAAEQELTERVKRVRELDIQPLDGAQRERYLADWTTVQERFVDTPSTSLAEADQLLTEVLKERGYPADDPYAALSVHHADALSGYRASRAAAERARQGEGATEELRESFVRLRAVFAALVNEGEPRRPVRVPAQRTSGSTPSTATGESV